MRTLTDAELATYREQGYVLVPGVFDRDEVARIDVEIDSILDRGHHDDPEGWKAPEGWIYRLHDQESDVCNSVARDPRVLELVEGVVSPGIALHSSKLVAKQPHSEVVCHWHQDEGFYLDGTEPEMRSGVRMSVWIPLQHADENNGCLWVVPGSHRDGLEAYENVGEGHCRKRILRADYADEHAVPLKVQAGDAVLFSGFLWHHSRGNYTDRVRRAFIISYQEAGLPHDAYGAPAPVLREPSYA